MPGEKRERGKSEKTSRNHTGGFTLITKSLGMKNNK